MNKNLTLLGFSAAERRAIHALAVALKAYDDANPDVGMGWPFSHFEEMAIKQLGYTRPKEHK